MLALFCAGCAAGTSQEPVVSVPTPVPQVAPDTPSAVLRDSQASQDTATRYVLSHGSTTAAIDQLTVLTGRVSAAVGAMRASDHGGRYDPARVRAARMAVDRLRAFLVGK